MKKVCAVSLVMVLVFLFFSCTHLNVEGKIIDIRFVNEENNIEARLKPDDAKLVIDMFVDKTLYKDTPPCDFSSDFALIIDGKSYCVANDGCPIIYIESNRQYFFLTKSEHKSLILLLNSYGVVFFEISEASD